MKKRILVSVILAIALGGITMHAAAESPRFQQDRFAIGFWVDPPIDEQADARYAEIAEAHFSFVIAAFGSNTLEKQAKALDLCSKYNLKALVSRLGRPPEELPEHPACWGYLLVDEPSADEFQKLGDDTEALHRVRPGRLAYINLLPGYASPWKQLGSETYDEHVRQFCEVVDPDVLSMDHYPVFKPDGDSRERYIDDLMTMRKYALQNNIPYWNFFNIMPYGPHTDPTAGQLRWQVFSSLACGAKGIMYFCYATPGGGEFPKGGAIIRQDGTRTRHYDQAKRINEAVKHLGPTLMQLTSTGVYRVTPEDDAAQALEGSPIRNITRVGVDPPNDYLVGAFQHADGRRAVMLNNYRFAFTAWPTVEFDADPADIVEVSQETGEETPLYDDSPAMEGVQVSLDSGEGRLFLLPAQK